MVNLNFPTVVSQKSSNSISFSLIDCSSSLSRCGLATFVVAVAETSVYQISLFELI